MDRLAGGICFNHDDLEGRREGSTTNELNGEGVHTERKGGNLTCSFFTQAEDALPKPWAGTWSELVRLLELTNRPGHRPKGDDRKKGLPAIAPATFDPLHRGKAEAQTLHLLCLDYDNAEDEAIPGEFHRSGAPKSRKVLIERPVLMEEVAVALGRAGTAAYLWTTWSNQVDWPKHRAVVPLAAPVPAAHWEGATEWALRALGLQETRRGLDLRALRDVARMYFLPGHPDGAMAIHRQTITGHFLGVPLSTIPKVPVPPLPRPAYMHQEMKRRNSVGYSWAAGLPVDLTTLRLHELIAAQGVMVGHAQPYGGGTKWRTHCLWPDEHTHGLDDDSGVVIHELGRWPTWHCSHSCHGHLSLVDVLRAAGVLR